MPRLRQPSINHTEPRTQTINHSGDPEIFDNSKSQTTVTESLPEQTVIVTDQGKEITVGEVKHSNRIIKSKTPKGDLSWWIKWTSSIIVLFAITIRSANIPTVELAGVPLQLWDMTLSWLGAIGWFVVGFMWKDRALILLNGVIGVLLFSGILRWILEH